MKISSWNLWWNNFPILCSLCFFFFATKKNLRNFFVCWRIKKFVRWSENWMENLLSVVVASQTQQYSDEQNWLKFKITFAKVEVKVTIS